MDSLLSTVDLLSIGFVSQYLLYLVSQKLTFKNDFRGGLSNRVYYCILVNIHH